MQYALFSEEKWEVEIHFGTEMLWDLFQRLIIFEQKNNE